MYTSIIWKISKYNVCYEHLQNSKVHGKQGLNQEHYNLQLLQIHKLAKFRPSISKSTSTIYNLSATPVILVEYESLRFDWKEKINLIRWSYKDWIFNLSNYEWESSGFLNFSCNK